MKAPEQYYGTGKRKTSIARVYLRPGNGQILVNKKSLDDYFGQEAHRVLVRQPLLLTENNERFNIKVNVRGGRSFRSGRRHPPRIGPRTVPAARGRYSLDFEKSRAIDPGCPGS